MKSQKKDLLDALDHLVIELAWSDKVSFEAIEQQTGKNEKQVIELMRRHLKPSSFKLWRTRVNGRNKKHEKLFSFELIFPNGQPKTTGYMDFLTKRLVL